MSHNKTYNYSTGAQASDMAKNYQITISNVHGDSLGGNASGGSGQGGNASNSLPGQSGTGNASGTGAVGTGGTGTSEISFANMISGLDDREMQIFNALLGENRSLSNSLAGISTDTSQKNADITKDLQQQYYGESKTVSDLTKTGTELAKLIVPALIFIVIYKIYKSKK